jgi:hypothetical protein
MSAIVSLSSQSERLSLAHYGTKWSYYSTPCRNSALGAPNSPFYGEGPLSPPLTIGVDTEYVAKEGGLENDLLSYQFYAFSRAKGGDWKGIHYPQRKRRITLARYVGSIIEIGLREGHIDGWPSEVFLCGHFTLADFPAFEDLLRLVRKMDSVRKTFVSLAKPIRITCYDRNRHGHKIEVHVRDSMLMAPTGKGSLKALGEILGIEKMELGEGDIERMDVLLKNDPEVYESYALRDAEIAARYCSRMAELNNSLLGEHKIPFTLSSLGVALLFQTWKETGLNPNSILGKEDIMTNVFNGKFSYNKPKSVYLEKVHLHEALAVECYHGGRNEQYFFGAGEVGDWVDYDLCGAYTTAMAMLGMPDWDNIRSSRDVDDYQPTTLGFARVEFQFPHDTRFPCLPVRTEAGLLFPLEGQSYCCAPELYLARKMGATVVIKDGIIVPQDLGSRPFAPFIQLATRNRKQHPKGSLLEQVWKELGNGTYGKTAQGLRKKRAYSCRDDKYDNLPPSKITNAYFAAWVTSMVRAVLGEILASLPSDVAVCNATTDGLLCTATANEMEEATNGLLCDLFRTARYLIVEKNECVEVKHRISEPLGMRTRGQLTLQSSSGEEPVLAKAGIKPPMSDKQAQNEWMINTFINRNAKTKSPVQFLRSMADICRKGGDLTKKLPINRSVRLDFDWKRKHKGECIRPIRGVDHIAFDTVPWLNVEQALECRKRWAAFVKSSDRVLKSLEDLQEFEAYQLMQGMPPAIRKSKRGGTKKVAVRQFLRAWVRSLAGLTKGDCSYQELAEFLTSLGIKTSKEDVENAARPKSLLVPHSIPRAPSVLEVFKAISMRFPAFDPGYLLVPADVVTEKSLHAPACSNASRSQHNTSLIPSCCP